MRNLIIFVITFLLIAHTHSAQEREYFVTKNNDTVYGEISRGFNLIKPNPVQYFLKDEQGNKIAINPATVKLIRSLDGVDGDSFIAPVYDRAFAKRIIDGRIQLYLSVDAAVFYTSKNGSTIQYAEMGGFSRKKAHAEIRPLLEDNPEISKEFDTLQGSERNIRYIIEKYNSFEK